MKILGVDPGTHVTGFGVVEIHGSCLVHVASGTIRTDHQPLPERLEAIANNLNIVFQQYIPEAVAVESIFHARNANSALKLGHARGVVLLCAAQAKLPIFEYTASQIKKATTGQGNADKKQVQAMVKLVLSTNMPMAFDASDALAAAICHASHAQSQIPACPNTLDNKRLSRKNRAKIGPSGSEKRQPT